MSTIGLKFEPIAYGKQWSVSRGTAKDAVVVIPATHEGKPVTEIADKGFADYTNLTKVTIPGSVTSICQSAFYGCKNLKVLNNASTGINATSIGPKAFMNTAIEKVLIHSKVTRINERAFYGTPLTSVAFEPARISVIDNEVFPGDLGAKYRAAGAGTYTRPNENNTWTKQGAVCPTCGRPF